MAYLHVRYEQVFDLEEYSETELQQNVDEILESLRENGAAAVIQAEVSEESYVSDTIRGIEVPTTFNINF